MKILVILLMLTSFALPMYAQKSDTPQQKIRIALAWKDQAQFAGIYMAREKGFFQRAGLDVEIVPCDENTTNSELVRTQQVDFSIMFLSTALDLISQDTSIELKHLSQIVRVSNCCIAAWVDSTGPGGRRVLTPYDLDGTVVTLFSDNVSVAYKTLFHYARIKPVFRTQYMSPALFLYGGAQACSVMDYNELDLLYQRGVRPDSIRVFHLSDYAIDMPEDGLYCQKAFFKKNPATACAVARAIQKGWEYARLHEEETLDVVMRVCSSRRYSPINRPLMKWMLRNFLDSVFPHDDTASYGKLSKEEYDKTIEWLRPTHADVDFPAYHEFITEQLQ